MEEIPSLTYSSLQTGTVCSFPKDVFRTWGQEVLTNKVIAYGFYHLARILLILYKPTPRFAIRNLHSHSLRDADVRLNRLQLRPGASRA